MTQKIGVVGGGVLGLTLAWRLAQLGHRVDVFEAGSALGGLAGWQDYGPFRWDRFYHCILPQDTRLIGLLADLGLSSELRFRETGTGYYAGGHSYPMSKSLDYLKFPLLSWLDKARVGATVLYAALAVDPMKLYAISAEEWLVRWCGRRGYEVFWRPLLRAKFGPFHDQIAAVFIWATLTRLFGARSGAASKEKLGYVRGGYRTILERFESSLNQAGAHLHTRAPVTSIARAHRSRQSDGNREATGECCELSFGRGDLSTTMTFDQVFFTGPTQLARRVVDPSLLSVVEQAEHRYPTAAAYLGVACLVLALKRQPLTPYYVLNVADEQLELTGVIEMTNLIDREVETDGLSLVYVPKYMDSDDPKLQAEDRAIEQSLLDRGLQRIFPDLAGRDIVYQAVHRTKYVQPLPLVRSSAPPSGSPALVRPFQVLNTSMLTCATLNNDEVVGFVDEFVFHRVAGLRESRVPWGRRQPALELPREMGVP